MSLSLSAKPCQLSLTAVIRTLKELKNYLPKPSKMTLPKVLTVDEFCSHASIEDKMSFICADGETGKLIDILPTRKLSRLTHYFSRCTNPEAVEYLMSEINAAYFQLTKRVLPNTKVVIDRFHIIKHLNQVSNDFSCIRNEKITSVKTTNGSRESEKEIIDQLLVFSTPLKEAYTFFHELTKAFRDKESDLFFTLLKSHPETLDAQFHTRLQNLLTYEEGIYNAMIYLLF